MDFTGIVSAIGQKGWRVALPVGLAGGAVWLIHRNAWVDPEALKPWLGAAVVAGLLGFFITALAFVSWLFGKIATAIETSQTAAVREAQNRQRYDAEFQNVMNRIAALEPWQRQHLIELLRTEHRQLFVVEHGNGPTESLVGVLIVAGERAHNGYLCQFHPIIQRERQAILDRFGN